MPVTPTPLSGTFYSASGGLGATSPSTSTSGTYGGPWAIERQELKIDYYRVPITNDGNMVSIDLSGDYTASGGWQMGTELVYKVTASYSMTKNYDSFDTSSFIQPQKFELAADQYDLRGTAYGAVDASTMGPAGSIITSQPYYRRVPWDDAIHTEVDKTAEGYNIHSWRPARLDDVGSNQQGFELCAVGAQPRHIQFLYGRMELYPGPDDAGTFSTRGTDRWEMFGPNYQIWGTYATDKDNLVQIFNFITSVGNWLRSTQTIANGAGSGYSLTTGGFSLPQPVMVQGYFFGNYLPSFPAPTQFITQYDPSRHEYV